MKYLIILFLIACCLTVSQVAEQKFILQDLKDTPDNVRMVNENFFDLAVNKIDNMKVYTSTPTVISLKQGKPALYSSGSIKRFVLNINDTIYYINLTAW